MNYHAVRNNLWEIITDRVHPEWLFEDGETRMIPSKFNTALRKKVNSFLITTTTNKILAGDCSNYTPNPQYLLEPFRWLKPDQVKVLIIGQDPYLKLNEAAGIAFLPLDGICTPSAKKINECLIRYGHISPDQALACNYVRWVQQGVLMINRALTTKEGKAGEHQWAWKECIDPAIRSIPKASVSLLLGTFAHNLKMTTNSVEKIEHLHPSPFNDDFPRTDIFGDINNRLVKLGKTPIEWRLM
jgi:uracil-DNA glycosylase